MHVLIGIISLAAVLGITLALPHGGAFSGILYPPALLLVGIGPFCMAVTSYRFEELLACARAVLKAMRFDAARSRAELYEQLSRFAAEVRQRRPAQALEVADHSSHDLLRQLGPLVVRQYSAEDIDRTASTALYVLVSARKRSEDVLTTLARVAPATGLVGTVLGLISLLKDLSRFDQLGPSMALALLCTLYGLVLANGLYQPLAKLIHSHATVLVEEAKLLTRGLTLVAENKPLADLRRLFDGAAAAGAPPAPVDVAVGSGQ